MRHETQGHHFGITEFFYFIDNGTGTWRSQGPLKRPEPFSDWSGAPSPPRPSSPCCRCALDTVLSHPPGLFSASFSPSPTGLLADLRTYQAGAHLRAFAYVASLVWNALCPDIHIIWSLLICHLLREILTSMFSIPFSCFALWLRPALRPHLCLLLPFLRQHHFFMTSPPP